MGRLLLILLAAAFPAGAAESWERAQRTGELRWGADATGGAPYLYRDPADPQRFLGFEVDLMEAVGRRLNLKAALVLTPWEELVPALLRDNFDLAFNGLEITEDRKTKIDFTLPYYVFSQRITVRRGENRFRTFDDLAGHTVGTLNASLAQTMLDQDGRMRVKTYPSPVEIYRDLELGRTDAVLLDVPIAAWYAATNPRLQEAGDPVGRGYYAGGVRRDSPVFREKIDGALAEMIRDGELERIYRKWNLWTEAQTGLAANLKAQDLPDRSRMSRYWGLLARGAGVTVLISVLAMALAVVAGFGISLGRLFGGPVLRNLLLGYVEITRGTPLLIQLYVLYYGLPNLGIHLNAFVAAVLGVGFNYAAYESEIYRAGILSVPRGQDEAARSLGMTRWQSLRYVILPQALRTILPPSTNDFIALFKDTSLVSVITVMELTRAYSQAATATFNFLQLGLITALLYLLMSLPLSYVSRRLEAQRHAVH